MIVPPEIVDDFVGTPQVGTWEPVFELVTVDDDGFPRTCFLSRSQLHAKGAQVFAVIAARHTTANLQREKQACLRMVRRSRNYDLHLEVTSMHREGSKMLATFSVQTVVVDELGAGFEPARFLVTSEIMALESWRADESLLERVSTTAPG